MSEPRQLDVLDPEGPAAPPRQNGELVFSAPWESRLFGLTMALHRSGAFDWEEFRRLLIEEIRKWESAHPGEAGWSYYERWQAAFERLLAAKGICPAAEIEGRAGALAARPPGHDH
jgi:nitrile hydratase accessory protein